jgi:hypothetical protein
MGFNGICYCGRLRSTSWHSSSIAVWYTHFGRASRRSTIVKFATDRLAYWEHRAQLLLTAYPERAQELNSELREAIQRIEADASDQLKHLEWPEGSFTEPRWLVMIGKVSLFTLSGICFIMALIPAMLIITNPSDTPLKQQLTGARLVAHWAQFVIIEFGLIAVGGVMARVARMTDRPDEPPISYLRGRGLQFRQFTFLVFEP